MLRAATGFEIPVKTPDKGHLSWRCAFWDSWHCDVLGAEGDETQDTASSVWQDAAEVDDDAVAPSTMQDSVPGATRVVTSQLWRGRFRRADGIAETSCCNEPATLEGGSQDPAHLGSTWSALKE